MSVQLKTTKNWESIFARILVHGTSGAGKTTLIKTLPTPIAISAEGGLLALAGQDVPYIEVRNMTDLMDSYEWATSSEEARKFESVALDSISEVAEVVLSAAKKNAKDPRQAYGELSDQMGDLIRAFRDIAGKHVYMSAKTEKSTDEAGRVMWAPSMPGNKVGQSLPYYFDEVLALRVEKNEQGERIRALMTDSDGLWTAKDRSGKLEFWEEPDLGKIIAKMRGVPK
jgi:phage nucleotide-binding protein